MSRPDAGPTAGDPQPGDGQDVAYTFPDEPLSPLVRGVAPVADDPVINVPFNSEKALHESRERIAKLVLVIFIGVLLGGMALFVMASSTKSKLSPADAKDAFLGVFTPMVGIVSGMLGYYYGGQRSRDK